VADLLIAGLKGPCEVVNVGVGSGELLGSDGGALFHCAGNFGEFVPTEVNESLGQAGRQGGIVVTQYFIKVARMTMSLGCR
jgi:hypothetical protein